MQKKLNTFIDNIQRKGKGREWLIPFQEGTYVFRILQDIEDEEAAPFEEFWLHSGFVLPLYQKKSNVLCLRHDCPMCNEAAKIKLKSPQDAWTYEAKQNYVYNIIDRKDGKLKLLRLSWAAHDKLKNKLIEAARDGVNIGHFKAGRDIEFTVRRIGSKTDYKANILLETESKPVLGKIIEELRLVKPLRSAYTAQSRQALQEIVEGKLPSNNYKDQAKAKAPSKASLMENLTRQMNEAKPGSMPVIKPKVKDRTEELRLFEEEMEKENSSAIKKKLDKLNIFDDEDEN